MATIRKEFPLARRAAEVWDVFRDAGAVHTRLAPGFVTDTRLEEGARVVTFANGFVARELLVTIDDEARRLAYAVVGSPNLTHHSASFEVREEGEGSRVVWIADLSPDAAAGQIGAMMEAGVAAMRRALG
jgi:carbon monoxide dehydrogenase subunit G